MKNQDDSFEQALGRYLASEEELDRSRFPVSAAQLARINRAIDQAEAENRQSIQEPGNSSESVRDLLFSFFRGHLVAWASAAALVLVCAGILFFSASAPLQLAYVADTGTKGGTETPTKLEKLMGNTVPLVLNFAKGNVSAMLLDGSKLSGSIAAAPQLNTFNEPNKEFFALNLAGTSKAGDALAATGSLQIRHAAGVATNLPAEKLSSKDIAWSKVELTLTSGAEKPIKVVREYAP